jgi:hypothetical protein
MLADWLIEGETLPDGEIEGEILADWLILAD